MNLMENANRVCYGPQQPLNKGSAFREELLYDVLQEPFGIGLKGGLRDLLNNRLITKGGMIPEIKLWQC